MEYQLRQRAPTAFAAALAWAAVAMPQAAHAQRGGDFVAQQEAPDTPRSGFPGAFNTHMPASESLVTNLPFFQADYGVTDNLALGINALPAFSVLTGEAPGAIARLRYRLYERDRVSAVAAVQAGYMPLALGEESPDQAWGGYASATVGMQLTESQRLAGTLLAGTLRMRNEAFRETSRISAIGLAVDYEAFFTDWLGLNLTAIGAPALASGYDSPGESASIRFKLPVQDRVAVRALGLLRLGDTWLLEAGGLASLSLSETSPWLSATKIW